VYVWITARRIKPGLMKEFLKAWHDPGNALPVSPSEPGGPTVYVLLPTDDPNEMWGVGYFDSLETIKRFKESPQMARRQEALSPYIEEVLWDRVFEAHPWVEYERPLYYAVYVRMRPAQRFRLIAVCPNAREAINQADRVMQEARASGYEHPEWTMRAFFDPSEAPDSLPPNVWHDHVR